MSYNIWGPKLWEIIHYLKPTNNKKFITFMYTLSCTLPCPKCKKHMREIIYYGYKNIEPLSKVISNHETYLKWTYDFHDCVNKFRGVTSPSYHLVKKRYLVKPPHYNIQKKYIDYIISICNVHKMRKKILKLDWVIQYLYDNIKLY